MRITTTSHELLLEDVLQLSEAGAFGLPDFQRQFKWGTDQVRGLLATVFMGWPAGLILLMESPPTAFFAVRALEGLPRAPATGFRHLILDGQQRVTALAQAFGLTNKQGDFNWYLDIDKFEEGYPTGDIEDAFVRRASTSRVVEDGLLIPVAALRSDAAFQVWRDRGSPLELENLPTDDSTYDRVNRAWVTLLSGAQGFRFPCTVLPADMPLSAVATIFEKLNTAGLALDTFDLVVAHVYNDGRNLRAVWEDEVARRPVLRHFAVDHPLIAAELVGLTTLSNTRRSGVLSLDANILWNVWPKAISAIEAAARFLSDRAGILNYEQLPHRGILLVLAGAAYDLNGLDPELDDLFLYWVYSRGLSERFNAAVNTRVVSEWKDLVFAAKGKGRLDWQTNPDALAVAKKQSNSSAYLTVQAIIRRSNPIDWPDGMYSIPVSPELSRPLSLLSREIVSGPNLALGFVLGSGPTEKLLANSTLAEIRLSLLDLNPQQVSEFLYTQMLPPLSSEVWQQSDAFLAARAELFVAAVQALPRRASHLTTVTSNFDIETEASIDLIREWLSNTEQGFRDPVRLEMSKRVVETLVDAGKPNDAAATVQLLLDTGGPWALAERVELALIQSRALASSGLMHEALAVLQKAQSDSNNGGSDDDVAQLKPFVQAELGSFLIEIGRPAEALAILSDALKLSNQSTSGRRLRAVIGVNLARGFSQVGDQKRARETARDVLLDDDGRLLEGYPDLQASARLLADGE